MLFWLIAAVLLAATVAVLLAPLLRRPPSLASRSEHEAAIYRDQLAEVGREFEGGLISRTEAEAAKLEVSRRLLAADGQQGGTSAQSGRSSGSRRAVAMAVVALLPPSAAIGLYLHLGSPQAWDATQAAALAAEHQNAGMSEAVQRLAAF